MSMQNVDVVGGFASALSSAMAEGKVTHLSFDAAGHGPAATGADHFRAQFREDGGPRAPGARKVLRGKALPREAGCGA